MNVCACVRVRGKRAGGGVEFFDWMLCTRGSVVRGHVICSVVHVLLGTGDKRICAGTPAGWIAGDKTGSGGDNGGRGATNDIAIIWPPNRAPIVLAIYFVESKITQAERDSTIAEAARIVFVAMT
jgi:hypothetical protein